MGFPRGVDMLYSSDHHLLIWTLVRCILPQSVASGYNLVDYSPYLITGNFQQLSHNGINTLGSCLVALTLNIRPR
ncbi:hypothetical protein N39L_62790 [Limnospira platensis NIES-39]|uniref:Uncharacterized protein n=1 Tax=Limnospira platensis NIES-46 TaxID=1236695 RepID=A0A5M3T9T8_LIMPL|nr:hypothetical protein N39L_62790 [Arthrospira platensis NIES-39]GCE95392.1 hypothetical protein NIES46_34550 [Arthrospira platensis NIES-46]